MNDSVDFSSPAELFPSLKARGRHVSYHRFDNLAEAVRFAVEELSPMLLRGATLEANEVRYDSAAIEAMYHSAGFPLPRR